MKDVSDLLKTYLRDVTQKNRLDETLEKYLTKFKLDEKLKKTGEIPFSSERKYSAVKYDQITLVLGAPEILLEKDSPFMKQISDFTTQSFRVVVFGMIQNEFDEKKDNIKKSFHPMAIIAFDDPIREEISATLEWFTKENIGYRIISGDSADTVSAIAKKINKDYTIKAITGNEMANLQGSDLERAILESNIFARIKPHQKQEIIRTLKKNKLFTVMIGDGVNDILAIKEADVGVAMNGGSSMAKDVADVVLINNSFATLPIILNEGRRIITNIQTIAHIYLIKNISSIASILMLGFIGLRFPFDPKHVEVSSFLIIGLPSFVLAFEKHNFAATDEGFIRRLLLFSGIVGFGNAIIYTLIYMFFDLTSPFLFYARSMLLTAVIFLGVNNIILIYLQYYFLGEIMRRKKVVFLIATILIFFLTVVNLSVFQKLFDFKLSSYSDLVLSFCFSALGSMIIFIVLKKLKLLHVDKSIYESYKNIAINPPITVASTPIPSHINP